MATFKEAEEYAGQNSCPPYPHSELGATENSAKSEQQGTLMAQTAKQERGRRSPFAHSHTPITAHLEPKMPALQSPPQHSLMGRR